ncbi:DUF6286 domain-containing protein [Arthrobacter castelli]|uniref:DUF6286 domain-containing protein n=1 Tax=Arthrobacter castelli TaxID=271431 RepID=UPI0004086805|nr:DUF6286 domain-containing protein [Arthrobacter castelli]
MSHDDESGRHNATKPDKAKARIIRRETHASRAVASIFAAILVCIVAVYVLFEASLKVFGQEPWLVDPDLSWQWIRNLPDSADSLLLGASGALIVLLGLFFFLNGVLPGRRSRHVIPNPRAAVIVDHEVVASSLARRARTEAGVTREQVVVSVSRRLVEVNVRPTSGIPVDEAAIAEAVEDELRRTSVEPMPDVRVKLAPIGVIGV